VKPSPDKLTAPAHLATTTGLWWESIANSYQMESHHLKLLTLAAEAWDRCSAARAAIDAHGITFEDRFGCPKPRPEIAIERDSRIAFARMVRELAFDVAPPPETRTPRRAGTGV
jgi:phage terminase small subunit